MSIESLVSDIIERIDYYEERRFRTIEPDCCNLESRYDRNDNTARGFLFAIRNQEHWKGEESFDEIAQKVIKVRNSKISRYLFIRSVDCSPKFIEKIFNPKMYTNGELQEIARFANSSQILEIIFQYVKYNIGKVCGYGILCCMARNPVAKSELLDELYLFDQRLAYQIFNNHEGKASTELLIQMFNECEENLRGLHLVQLVQFDRKEINEQLRKYLISRLIRSLKIG